jgi:glycosyltransferase involved in cell wall biosynthesis
MLARFDKAVLASAADRDFLLQSWGPLPLSVVANGVDLDYFRPQPAAQDSPSLVFVGDLTYFPNEDAVLYFCSKILPLITKRCRPVRFYVVGRGGANRLFKAASQPNVVFAGFVSDIRPIVAEASVVVCPLRIGTGIKMKVLLAMAMGKATVSSSVGVEGIAVRQGEHVVVADTPGEFSAAILRLLEDAGLRRSLGLSARALVEREHDWGRLAERWNELYGECEACRSGSQKARRQP